MILFLKPYFETKPWAGKVLNEIYDCPNNSGEAWIVSGYKNKSSIITSGRYKGQTLRHLWTKHPELFGDFSDKEFPVLIKLISSKENLSVQVHPDDDYAIKIKNSLGKFECWYILPQTKAKDIILGINASNSIELKDILNKNLIEDFLINKAIKPDDLIIVEPGTVHAIKADTFLLEVQESSDITYRLYDYNREPKRELHIEDSLNVINYNNQINRIHNFKEQDTFKNKHFDMYKMNVCGSLEYKNTSFEIFYVISGTGIINGYNIHEGDTFILTKDTKNVLFNGNLEIIGVVPKEKDKERLKMRKTAFITGITGQDGYYLSKLLLGKDYEVHGLIQSKSLYESRYVTEFLENENFFLHIGDLTDASNLNRILDFIKPDEIYHLAQQSHVDLSYDMPEYTTEVNSLGTLRLLDAIKNSEFRTKIFNLCSPYMFSGDIYPQTEMTSFDPKSPYAVSKVFSYNIAKCYRENFNLFITNGICYNHDSIMRDLSYVSMKIILAAKKIKGGKFQILKLGNLNAIREWGMATDYANAMWLSLQQYSSNDFIISTGKAISIREFVTRVYKKVGIDLIWQGEGLDEIAVDKNGEKYVEVDIKFFRVNDASILVGDSTKFKKETNFKFNDDIDSLIDMLLED